MSFFRHKPPPTPEPFNALTWIERCVARLKRQYTSHLWLPSGHRFNLGVLVRLFRYVRAEHFVEDR